VHICVDHEDDPGAGSIQQVDHKVVVNNVNNMNVDHVDVDVNTKTVENVDLNNANVNETKVREDDLEDVLEIIKGLEGDQITENKASKEMGQEPEISGVSNESNKKEDKATT
jgi:hypothetical protein